MARKQPAKKVAFSKTRLENLPLPPTGRTYVYDSKVAGLAVCLTAAGRRTFYLYRWIDKRPQRYRIGRFPDLSVEQARREAARLNGQIAQGIDPQDRKRAKREEPTFGEVFADYVEQHAKIHKGTWQQDVEMFDRHLKHLASRRVSTITQEDVERVKVRIGGQGGRKHPYAANRVLALIGTVFNKAAPFGVPNPTHNVDRFPEEERDRHMSEDELKRFFKALDEEPDPWSDLFGLAIFTGARRGNLFAMKWGNVDLENRQWTVPAEESKNGRAMHIPLSEPAAEILRRRAANNGDSKYVFPSATSTAGHIKDSRKAWKRVCKRADLADLRMHDLRRSLASVMINEGVPILVVGRILGHLDVKSTQVYARLDFAPQLEAVEKAGQSIQAIIGDTPLALAAAAAG